MIRTDKSTLLWAPESTYNVFPRSNWKRFGMVDSAIPPDPSFEWTNYYSAFGGRRRETALKGRQTLSGSIQGIRIQDADILSHLFNTDNVTFRDLSPIPSFSLAAGIYDTNGDLALGRVYSGGKINRATISLKEGEELRLTLDEILFASMYHNRNTTGPARYDTYFPTDPGLSRSNRFVFSGAVIQAFGQTFAHIKSLSLSINNNCVPYYGLKEVPNIDWQTQPTSILDGQADYKLTGVLDVQDNVDLEFWDFLIRQGSTLNPEISMVLNFERVGQANFRIYCSLPNTTGTVFENMSLPMNVASSGLYEGTFTASIDRLGFTIY